MTVIIAKAKPANWPRLYKEAAASPKNLGIWRDMREKWKDELGKYPEEESQSAMSTSPSPAKGSKKEASKKSSKRKSKAKEKSDDEDDDAVDRETDLLSECEKSTYAGTPVAELCKICWEGVAESPAVRGRRG